MKKSKRPRQGDPQPADRDAPPKGAPGRAAQRRKFVWWPWAAAVASLFLVFEIYGPALNGPFLLDDLYLRYANPQIVGAPLRQWLADARPMLMASFWLNHEWTGDSLYAYHATNVVLHFLVSVLIALIAMRLLAWADGSPSKAGGPRAPVHATLGIFAGALFLVHPIQTESVAYIASRSETLSVLFYYSAYCVFLYRRTESITLLRALAVIALFGAAVATKQHTLTLPLLLFMTDLYWTQGSVRANRLLYVLLGLSGAGGLAYVWSTLRSANTAGFHVAGFTPFSYFFTECRMVWIYVRMFVLPFGQNADPDVTVSKSLFDSGAIVALAAWVAVAAAAWFYRKRWPLACFGVFVFLLLVSPTSSVIPISEPLQERRLYLPFLGLALVCLEFLRRLDWKRRVMIEAPVLIVLMALTYQRSAVWGDSMALWTDTVAKSPRKVRPRFQLAYAYYEQGKFGRAAENYNIAERLAPPDYRLLVDYALALDSGGSHEQALAKLQQASTLELDPEVWTLIARVYGELHKTDDAFQALNRAESIDPGFEMTYAIRGNVYESLGNTLSAAEQYRHALEIDPYNEAVRQALARAEQRR
jgi:tetratricopeptide (TPR) repeat protein